MRQLVLILFLFVLGFGQITILNDDFDSGSIASWTEGTAGHWTSSTSSPINGTHSLKHNLSAVAGESYITHGITLTLSSGTVTWRWQQENGAWDPSGSNKFLYYLYSDNADLTSTGAGTQNGYAVGMNFVTNDDQIKLYRVTAGAFTEIINAGITYDVNASTLYGIEVTRTAAGLWELLIDSNGGFDALVSTGTVTDATHTTTTFTGAFFDFTSSRAGLLRFDDILIQQAGSITEIDFSSAPTLIDSTQSSATLRWVANDSSTSTIRYRVSGNPTWLDSLVSLDSLATDTALISGLLTDQEYEYSVTLTATQFVDDSTTGILTFSTAPNLSFSAAPDTTAVGENSATIAWTTNLAATGTLEYGLTTSYGSSVASAENTSQSESITSLIPGQKYYYRVTAIFNTSADTVIHLDSLNTHNATGSGGASDLFISEYIEGSGNNKSLEIYNGTGATIDLAAGNYTLSRYTNGSATPSATFSFVGSLAHDSVFVISNSGSSAGILALTDSINSIIGHNGDDAYGLYNNGTLIDVFGEIGNDPGSAWDVAGTTGATVNHTLVRKSTVSSGNTDYANSFGTTVGNSEWTVLANDITDSLGFHNFIPPDGTMYLTGVSQSSILMADDQGLYTVFAMTLQADSVLNIDSLYFNQIGSSDFSSLNEFILYHNGTALDTLNSISGTRFGFEYTLADQSYDLNSDTVYLRIRSNAFNQNQNFQFQFAQSSDLLSNDNVIVSASSPINGPTVTYSHLYNISAVAAPSPSITASTESWQGYFSIDQTNSVTSMAIANRAAGTVSASDISEIRIYVTGSTADPTGGSVTGSVAIVDDGAGGSGTINFGAAQSTTGNFFHVVYLLSGSVTTTDQIGVSLTALSFSNAMTLNGSLPLDMFNDVTLPVVLAPMDYIDQGKKGIDILIKTLSEPENSELSLIRYDKDGESLEIGRFTTDGSVSHGKSYFLRDKSAQYGEDYTYRLFENDFATSQSLTLKRVPSQFEIGAAYPNPFNPSATIDFLLPEKSHVSVQIFNVLGQLVLEKEIRNLEQGLRHFTWNGKNKINATVTSGMYFLKTRIISAKSNKGLTKTQKVILLK